MVKEKTVTDLIERARDAAAHSREFGPGIRFTATPSPEDSNT